MKAKRTGSAFTYERGDRVETPFGEATIETDPDDHGRCKIRVAAFDEKENPVSATTFQFGKIIAKRDATGPEAFKARRLKKPDLSPRGPYASAEDIGIAAGVTTYGYMSSCLFYIHQCGGKVVSFKRLAETKNPGFHSLWQRFFPPVIETLVRPYCSLEPS